MSDARVADAMMVFAGRASPATATGGLAQELGEAVGARELLRFKA